ncbi:LamG domain-containing protein, partial [bacterium]|nr:LamG domain-containing protein [bacterium]
MKRLLLIFVISAIMPELLHAQLHTRLLVHFDEGSGTIAHDSSGNNLHGTLGGVPTWTSGYVGGGLQFDGNGDRVDFGSSDLLRPDILTCEAWIYADSLRQQEMLIVTSGKDFNGFVLSLREGGKPSFDCQGSGSRHIAMSPDPLTIHQWHHLAGTFDGTTVRIFVNGACRASVLGTLSPATYPLLVGTDVTPPYTSDPFFGKIDEVQITDTVRYLCGENCAISLDGITAYGAVPDNPVLQFGSGNFTMEVMVRVDRIGTVYDFHLVTKGRYSNIAYFRLGIYLGTNWPVFCGASNNIEWNATSPDPISIGEWHHIAGVREGNTYILYVDGIEKARANLAVGSVDTNDSLFIGYLPM